MTVATTKRITIATVKSFIAKNRPNLLICQKSSYDSMEDGVRSTGNRDFSPALESDRPCSNNMGIHGAWFVMRSNDWFEAFSNDEVVGYEINNSCGTFILAIKR